MNDFMNPPDSYEMTDEDIVMEYERCHDKRKVSKIWGVTVKEINEILKRK